MDLLDGLAAQLAELGLDARVGPSSSVGDQVQRATLRLARGASAEDYILACGPHVRLTDIGHTIDGAPFFAYAPHITARTGDRLRRAGAQYLDGAGNAWIQFGDVLIDVRGRPR